MTPNEKAAAATAAPQCPITGQKPVTRIIRNPRGNASTLTEISGDFKQIGRLSADLAPI